MSKSYLSFNFSFIITQTSQKIILVLEESQFFLLAFEHDIDTLAIVFERCVIPVGMCNRTYRGILVMLAAVGVMSLLLCAAIEPCLASKIEGIVVIEILWAKLVMMAVEYNGNTDMIGHTFDKHLGGIQVGFVIVLDSKASLRIRRKALEVFAEASQ